jgi:type III secretory pathway component EscT
MGWPGRERGGMIAAMDELDSAPDATRRLSPPLLLGMLLVPIIFVWFFLRRGYAPSLRVAAFAYTGTFLAIGLLGRFGGR